MSRSESQRVVITGLGAVTNVGLNAGATMEAITAGRSGIGRIEGSYFDDWPDDQWPVKIAGEVKDFDPGTRIDGREAKRMDRFAQLGVTAAIEAFEYSGLDDSSMVPERSGVIIGSGVGGIQTIESSARLLFDRGPGRISPMTVPRLMANAVSGDVAIRFNLQGPSDAHVTACASSGHSMADAVKTMRRGEADVMLVGGAEAAVSPLCVGAFMNMKALSTRNDEPEKASRPFDKDRDGFVLAEGAAVFVLETLEHAKARGATIHAEILGAAASTDAHHITAPDPNGRGAMASMRRAIEDAEIDAADVGYVNAHGTSTPLGDAAEVAAVKAVFGSHAKGGLMMSSTKSMIGHCLGASGGVETLACILALRDGVVPPTINLDEPDEAFDLDFVAHEAREAKVRVALNNTFGFGGHNLTLVLGRFDG